MLLIYMLPNLLTIHCNIAAAAALLTNICCCYCSRCCRCSRCYSYFCSGSGSLSLVAAEECILRVAKLSNTRAKRRWQRG